MIMSPQPNGGAHRFGADPVGIGTLSPEPVSGFWPNLHRRIIGTGEISD